MQSAVDPTPKALPKGYQFQSIGTVYEDTVPIFIFDHVLEGLIEFSERETRYEVGGFLLGGLHDDGHTYLEIRHFLPAAAHSGAASLKFTHRTWSAAHQRIDRQFEGERIVGWQHTHPGFGVFLSAYDMFIHRHYFSEPWQVALVVDPKRHEFGFFQWRHGEVVDCGFVCIYENGPGVGG